MKSILSSHGRTVIPAPIRRRYDIHEGDQLVWLDDGKTIKVLPIPADPIRALRGSGRSGRLVEKLLETRREDPSLQ